MKLKKVKRRNGENVDFEKTKIVEAIKKALIAKDENPNLADSIADQVVDEIEKNIQKMKSQMLKIYKILLKKNLSKKI